MLVKLDTKIESLPRIGKTTASRFERLDIVTVLDALWFLPFRYEDFSETLKIKDLKANTKANIVGQVELIQNKKSRVKRMNITEALISDESGSIKVIWFNQPFVSRVLKPGDSVSLSGKIDNDFTGLVIKSPEYEKNTTKYPDGKKSVYTQGLVPSYNLTQNLSQKH